MLVLGQERLREAVEKHGDCKDALAAWLSVAGAAAWHNLVEVRATYVTADWVSGKTVFNIKRNRYRLITIIDYEDQTIMVQDVLTHAEYDRGRWKS